MRNENGYTLLTLILCMFLLLILACVSIALVVTADQKENSLPKQTSTYIEELQYEEKNLPQENNAEANNPNGEINNTNEIINNVSKEKVSGE